MKTIDAAQLCLVKMDEHGLLDNGWTFKWNNRKRACGVCRHGKRTIELSRPYVQHNPIEMVLDTILHEIAHAIAGSHAGHGIVWQMTAMRIGAKPKRCNDTATMPEGKYKSPCFNCGQMLSFHRPVKRRYSHKVCPPKAVSP